MTATDLPLAQKDSLVAHHPGVLRHYRSSQPSAIVVDSPHSGRSYPNDFNYAVAHLTLRGAEDAYVDHLCEDFPSAGASLLLADFPRSYLDVNRYSDDIAPQILHDDWPGELKPGPKSKLGVGLIRTRLASGDVIYDRQLSAAEVKARIDQYYVPYHDTLKTMLDDVVKQHGFVWHINMHSMASRATGVTPDAGQGDRTFDIVLGDLDGTSCSSALRQLVLDWFKAHDYRVRINDPYKGAAITKMYGNPSQHRHTMQIEINRALYLDQKKVTPHTGSERLKRDLTDLVRVLAEESTNQSF